MIFIIRTVYTAIYVHQACGSVSHSSTAPFSVCQFNHECIGANFYELKVIVPISRTNYNVFNSKNMLWFLANSLFFFIFMSLLRMVKKSLVYKYRIRLRIRFPWIKHRNTQLGIWLKTLLILLAAIATDRWKISHLLTIFLETSRTTIVQNN